MPKKYADFLSCISAEELYNGFVEHGLFSEKLPPIFDGANFLDFCLHQKSTDLCQKSINLHQEPANFLPQAYNYARFDITRNNNLPRTFGIPTPMAHERLCAALRDYWPELRAHFREKTGDDTYKRSRVHVRKRRGTTSLFEMNYRHVYKDGFPEQDLALGKRYLVHTDIAKCFASIHVHAISWALAGKTTLDDTKPWHQQLSLHLLKSTGNAKQGIPIGPHTSNLLSEALLVAIDKELADWDYVRTIDDYECYVSTIDEAHQFILELSEWLRYYGLSVNRSKTTIHRLPSAKIDRWRNKIQESRLLLDHSPDTLRCRDVSLFLNHCVELMEENGDDAAIVFYGIKILVSAKYLCLLTDHAKEYIVSTATSLALLYPYLVHILDQYAYEPCGIKPKILKNYLNRIFDTYLADRHLDAVARALQLAVKYDVSLNKFDIDMIIRQNSCILTLCALIYARHFHLQTALESLEDYALHLKNAGLMDEHWVFVYECLPSDLLSDDWQRLKQAGVSFLKTEYQG